MIQLCNEEKEENYLEEIPGSKWRDRLARRYLNATNKGMLAVRVSMQMAEYRVEQKRMIRCDAPK